MLLKYVFATEEKAVTDNFVKQLFCSKCFAHTEIEKQEQTAKQP